MSDITGELRDNIANFDDFFRPIRNYLYWEPHCQNIPICFSFRSIFDVLDDVDTLANKLDGLTTTLDKLDKLLPQLT